MYMCVCVYIYMCVRVCMYVRMHACMSVIIKILTQSKSFTLGRSQFPVEPKSIIRLKPSRSASVQTI